MKSSGSETTTVICLCFTTESVLYILFLFLSGAEIYKPAMIYPLLLSEIFHLTRRDPYRIEMSDARQDRLQSANSLSEDDFFCYQSWNCSLCYCSCYSFLKQIRTVNVLCVTYSTSKLYYYTICG